MNQVRGRARGTLRPRLSKVLVAAGALTVAGSVVAAVPAVADGPVVIEVSPTGDDANTGSSGSPVATLQRAQELVRAALPGAEAPVTVEIAPGDYYLSEPLELTNADSGTEQAPVTWEGTGDGVRISGGRALSPEWTPSQADPSIMVTPVPEGIDFDELFVGGARQVMARYPNYDESAARLEGYDHDRDPELPVGRLGEPDDRVRARHALQGLGQRLLQHHRTDQQRVGSASSSATTTARRTARGRGFLSRPTR